MAAIPGKYLDLLQQKKAFANLTTAMPDGSPQVTPVWFDYHDGLVRVNTAKGRVKTQNMKTGVPVALAIMDPDNPYRYLQVRSHVGRWSRPAPIGTSTPRRGQVSVRPARRDAGDLRDRARLRLRMG
jgi:PPOX class probable F420-dependent enzyme